MKKVEVVDYLKGYSIITIVLMHLIQNNFKIPKYIFKLSSFGGAGVHVFILASGFGLFYSYLNRPLGYREFLKRRFSKIYMPYIAVIVVSALVPYMYTHSDKIIALLSHVFLFKMFVNKYEGSFGGQFWFISTIIQFYLVFNLIVILKEKIKSNKIFLIITLAISILWWIVTAMLGKSEIRVWNSFFLQYLWEFSLGCVLAEIIHDNNNKLQIQKSSKLIILLIALVNLGLYGVLGLKGGMLKLFNDIPSLIGYGGLAVFIYSLNIKFINKIFLVLNKFSYELYLVHSLVFSTIFKILGGILPQILTGIIAFAAAIIIAKLYNIVIVKFKELNSSNENIIKAA